MQHDEAFAVLADWPRCDSRISAAKSCGERFEPYELDAPELFPISPKVVPVVCAVCYKRNILNHRKPHECPWLMAQLDAIINGRSE